MSLFEESARRWYSIDMSLIFLRLPAPDRLRLERVYKEHADSWERALFEIHRRIRGLLMEADIRATVKYRLKSFPSYYRKLSRRREEQSEAEVLDLTDLLGIRIVCPFIEDLELVETILAKEYELTEREKKGAEFTFKEFGYESVHLLARLPVEIRESFHLPDDTVFEVQLRTILQDAWAEVEHELVYKSEYTAFDEALRRKLAALNANLSLADMIFHEIRVFQRELQEHIKARRKAFIGEFGDSRHPDQGDHEESWSAPPIGPEPNSLPARLGSNGPPHIPGLSSINGNGNSPGSTVLLQALDAHNHHDYQTGVKLYTKLLEMDERPAVVSLALIHRGMALFSLGRYPEAHADFEAAVREGTDLKRAYHYRGVSFRQRGDYAAATEDFSASLERDPFQFDVLMSRGQTYFRLGNLEDALRDCDAALALESNSASAKSFREQIMREMGM